MAGTDWIALAAALGPVLANLTKKKGQLKFAQQPETPEEMAVRLYAQRMAGIPSTPGGPTPAGAFPTLSYLGPQIQNQLQNYSAQANDYQPLARLDPITGKPQAVRQTPTNPFDYSKLQTPWTAATAAGSTATGTPMPVVPPSIGTAGGGAGGTAIEPRANSTDRRLPNMSGDTGSLIGGATIFDPNMLGRGGNNPNIKPGPYGSASDGGLDMAGLVAGIGQIAGTGSVQKMIDFLVAHPGAVTLIGSLGGPVGSGIALAANWALKHFAGTTPPPTVPTNPVWTGVNP